METSSPQREVCSDFRTNLERIDPTQAQVKAFFASPIWELGQCMIKQQITMQQDTLDSIPSRQTVEDTYKVMGLIRGLKEIQQIEQKLLSVARKD